MRPFLDFWVGPWPGWTPNLTGLVDLWPWLFISDRFLALAGLARASTYAWAGPCPSDDPGHAWPGSDLSVFLSLAVLTMTFDCFDWHRLALAGFGWVWLDLAVARMTGSGPGWFRLAQAGTGGSG